MSDGLTGTTLEQQSSSKSEMLYRPREEGRNWGETAKKVGNTVKSALPYVQLGLALTNPVLAPGFGILSTLFGAMSKMNTGGGAPVVSAVTANA